MYKQLVVVAHCQNERYPLHKKDRHIDTFVIAREAFFLCVSKQKGPTVLRFNLYAQKSLNCTIEVSVCSLYHYNTQAAP